MNNILYFISFYVITLAILGCNRTFNAKEDIDSIPEVESCSFCNGIGKIIIDCDKCEGTVAMDCEWCNASGKEKCYRCNGTNRIKCTDCYSTGINLLDEEEPCPICYGKGYTFCSFCINGYEDCNECDGEGTKECDACNGKGKIIINCKDCNGKGSVVIFVKEENEGDD